jgi:hypothetical protein
MSGALRVSSFLSFFFSVWGERSGDEKLTRWFCVCRVLKIVGGSLSEGVFFHPHLLYLRTLTLINPPPPTHTGTIKHATAAKVAVFKCAL